MRQTLVLDSSQISTHFECAMMHNLAYDERLTTDNNISEAIAAGTFGHKLLEILYTTGDLESALTFKPEPGYPLTPEMEKKVKDRFFLYYCTYSQQRDIIPATRDIHRIRIDESSGMPIDVIEEELLVEKGFSYELLNTREYLFVLEGRIDLIGHIGGTLVFMDHKWQFRRHQLYAKSIQFRNYALATGIETGIINYIRMADNIDKYTFERKAISFTYHQLREWKEQLTEVFIDIAKDKYSGRSPKKNWASCTGKFGYPCIYTQICEETDPKMIQIMKSRYVKKEEWKPW